MPSSLRRGVTALLAPLALLAAGCAGPAGPSPLAVGTTGAPESLVLAHLYAGALRGSGVPAEVHTVPDPLAMLDSGAVSVVPGLTGRLLADFAPHAGERSDKQVYRAMLGVLPEGITAGDYATAADDKPALVITAATAEAWGGADLRALHCGGLAVGAVRGAATPESVGHCRLPAVREFPDTAALFTALRAGRLTAAWTTTAAPDTPADLVLLADRDPALVQAENVVPIYRRNELAERQVLALNEVAGVLDTAALIEMRRQVAGGAAPAVVVDGWLAEHPLGR